MAFGLTANLNLNIRNFVAGLSRAATAMGSFANRLNAAYGDANSALHKHSLGLKDTARIVQGILISQTFYAAVGAIRDATTALTEFNEKLDYAKVTYTALFGSVELANNFSKALQEKSIETIFDYDTLATASKRMLAYGIEYENLLYIMEGLTNFGAMSGDAAAMDRMALAIGQIATRGTLKAEEMRQLANAYVPIYDIIQSSFGLSGDQMGKVGDLNLPAYEVINAIVDYSEEKFGDVADAAMLTITGLKNRIVDTLKVMGSDMMMPLTTAWKSFLTFVSNGLNDIRDAYNSGGIGGVFEHLVPDKGTQTLIRTVLANIHTGMLSIVAVLRAIVSVAGPALHATAMVFNLLAPIISHLVASIANLITSFTQTTFGAAALRYAAVAAAGALAILAARAIAATVVHAVTVAVNGLSRALMLLTAILSANKIVAGLALLAVGLAGVVAVAPKASQGLSGLFSDLSKASGGIGSNDVLQKTNNQLKDGANAADAFSNKLSAGADAADKLADAVGGAGSAAKKAKAGLLSFDEVFKLADSAASGGGGGGGGGLTDAIGGLVDGLGGAGAGIGDLTELFKVPDFSEYADNFVGMLKGSLLGKLAASGLGMLIAKKIFDHVNKPSFIATAKPAVQAIMRWLYNIILGAAIGLGFDAIASIFTDKLWEAIELKFKLKDNSAEHASIGATIGSVLGGAIGFALGGIPGALAGAGVGHLAGGLVGLLWDEVGLAISNSAVGAIAGIGTVLAKAMGTSIKGLATAVMQGGWTSIFANIGNMLKTAGLKSLLKGGLIGMAIGLVTDGIAALLWNTLAEKFSLGDAALGHAKIGQTIGSVVGAVVGGLLGGPAGAMIGSAIGTFAGGFVGLFWNKIVATLAAVRSGLLEWSVGIATAIGEWGLNIVNKIASFLGVGSGSSSGSSGSSSSSSVTGAFDAMQKTVLEMFVEWLTSLYDSFIDWSVNIATAIGEWGASTIEQFADWITNTYSRFTQWHTDVLNAFVNWATNVTNHILTWVYDTSESIKTWATDALKSISKWVFDTKTKFTEWSAQTAASVANWVSQTIRSFGNFVAESARSFATWITNTATSVKTWGTELYNKVKSWIVDTGTNMGSWLDTNIWSPIKSFFDADNMWRKLRTALNELKSKISSWWKEAIKSIFSGNFRLGLSFTSEYTDGEPRTGHSVGGVFNREHIARFAEGNKAEAIIPLENETAMRPFVDAVSNGIVEALAPIVATTQSYGNANNMPPMYVGTLIADERGIKQLYKKFEVIRAQENARTGLA